MIIRHFPLTKGVSTIDDGKLQGTPFLTHKKLMYMKGINLLQLEQVKDFLKIKHDNSVFSCLNSVAFTDSKIMNEDDIVDWEKTLSETNYTKEKESIYALYCTYDRYVTENDGDGNGINYKDIVHFVLFVNERSINNRLTYIKPTNYPKYNESENKMFHFTKMINVYGGVKAKLVLSKNEIDIVKNSKDYTKYTLVSENDECINFRIYDIISRPKNIWVAISKMVKSVFN